MNIKIIILLIIMAAVYAGSLRAAQPTNSIIIMPGNEKKAELCMSKINKQLPKGKRKGTYHFSYESEIKFSREPLKETTIYLKNNNNKFFIIKTNKDLSFSINEDLYPGNYTIYSDVPWKSKYRGAYGSKIEISSAGKLKMKEQPIFHELKSKPFAKSIDSQVKETTIKRSKREKTYHFSYDGKVSFAGKPLKKTKIYLKNNNNKVLEVKTNKDLSFSIITNIVSKRCYKYYYISSEVPETSKYWNANIANIIIENSVGKMSVKELPGIHKLKIRFIDTLGMTNFYLKKPLLKWKQIEGAKYYLVSWSEKTLDDRPKISNSKKKVKTVKSEYQIKEDLIRNRKHEWKVEAYDSSDNNIAYNSFAIEGPPCHSFFQASIWDSPRWLHIFPNHTHIWGMRLNLPYGNNSKVGITGLDLGLVGMSYNLNGMGVGVANIAKNVNGVVAGIANFDECGNSKLNGVAVGIGNGVEELNGISIGASGLYEAKNVNGVIINGQIEVVAPAINIFLLPVAFIRGGADKNLIVNGIYICSLFGGSPKKVNGVSLIGLISGCQEITGVQISSLVNVSENVNGCQFAALANDAENLNGFQFGCINDAKEGVQIGIYNHNTGTNGLQFGLLNYNKNGFFKIFPFINFGCE